MILINKKTGVAVQKTTMLVPGLNHFQPKELLAYTENKYTYLCYLDQGDHPHLTITTQARASLIKPKALSR